MNLKKKTSIGGRFQLSAATYAGNTRQLENEVKRLVGTVCGKTKTEEQLDAPIRSLHSSAASAVGQGTGGAEVTGVSILAGRSRAIRTPPNRRGTAKILLEANKKRLRCWA